MINSSISYHNTIVLQLEKGSRLIRYHFKFNVVWLEEAEFVDLIKRFWNSIIGWNLESLMEALVHKLKCLKNEVKKWESDRKRAMKDDLIWIENQIDFIYSKYSTGIPLAYDKLKLLELEGEKLEI